MNFPELEIKDRHLVRLVRRQLQKISETEELSAQQMLQIAEKLLSQERFAHVADRKKELAEIAVFDRSPRERNRPHAWRHEYEGEFYPPVEKPVEAMVHVASSLAPADLLLFFDLLETLHPATGSALRQRFLDLTFLDSYEDKMLQILLRRLSSKIISDAVKGQPVARRDRILANISNRVKAEVAADFRFHDTLSPSQVARAVMTVVQEDMKMKADPRKLKKLLGEGPEAGPASG